MFAVGLDVDALVSIEYGNKFKSIRLFAGTSIEVRSTWSLFKPNLVGIILTQEESAGNYEMGDSLKWALCTVLKSPKKFLSEHRPNHRQPSTSAEMGSYLAGLIEGGGCFSGKRLEIVLHFKDIDLAYRIKKWIGYGSVYKIKDKNAVKYCLTKKEGLKKVLFLTNSFWVGPYKLQQIQKHGLDQWTGLILKEPCGVVQPNSFWTAGFLDTDGCLNVYMGKTLTHVMGKRPQIQVRAKQKESFLPECLKACWGGSLSFTKIDFCTTWSLAAVQLNKKGLFDWFLSLDHYPLQSSNKYTQYVLLRKAFLLMQYKQHLIPEGLAKIEKLHKQISLFYPDLKKRSVHPS
jgi:hypothetical protein